MGGSPQDAKAMMWKDSPWKEAWKWRLVRFWWTR